MAKQNNTKDSDKLTFSTEFISAMKRLSTMPVPDTFYSATGKLPYTMTKDIVFHIVFETTPIALKGFLCSLLRLSPEEIISVEITNPIKYGDKVNSKYFILDMQILLNNHTIINLEMQVVRHVGWEERSIGYLCRCFDTLNSGQDYAKAKPAIHIGIVDFTMFPEEPEFYSTYHLANDITHKIYSDKFRISVLQLNHSNLATKEQKAYQLDLWANFFKATTWEEILMLAEQNPDIMEAAKTLYRITSDPDLHRLCNALVEERIHEEQREIRERENTETIQQQQEELTEVRQERDAMALERDNAIEQSNKAIEIIRQKDESLAAAQDEIARLRAELKAKK